jgi:predicted MFS family arabinose efflux permease
MDGPAAQRPNALVWIMAVACGVGVANIYYNQPLLTQMGGTFRGSAAYLPMFTQIGAGLGMFLFVPLGDMLERRRLIVMVCGAAAVAAILNAVSPSLELLSLASLILGLASIVPHLILPFAAQIAAPSERGHVVGTVLSGLLIGILVARTVSGFLGASFGWRTVYWIAAGLMCILAVTLGRTLPKSEPHSTLSYPQLLRSILTLIREQPLLREASAIGALLFGAFSVFWATLIYRLSEPPFHYGARTAGLFGLVGVAGALAAAAVGRVADRKGPRFTVGIGIAITVASYVVFSLTGSTIIGLVAGVILLDLGVQAGHVSNQTRIYGILPEARSRLNTVYMVTYFLGGSIGSALGAYGWKLARWNGVCAAGFALSILALAVHLRWKTDV